ncbi:MAG: cytochrome c3 family protein [Bacteroidota bacterium]
MLVACSPTARHAILKTIFDGVPPLESPELTAKADTLKQVDTTNKDSTNVPDNTKRTYYHLPYLTKECASCHSEQHMGQLVKEEPDLCIECHVGLASFDMVRHGPVRGGYCSSCHNPHKSEEKGLLIAGGEKLCYTCHDQQLTEQTVIHQKKNKKGECLTCHSPHSSDNGYLLTSDACYQCHDKKVRDYSFLHGPVAGNYCTTCHSDHGTGSKGLLIDAAPELCLGCHTESTIFMNKEHQVPGIDDCLNCHNPHGGENQFFLR